VLPVSAPDPDDPAADPDPANAGAEESEKGRMGEYEKRGI